MNAKPGVHQGATFRFVGGYPLRLTTVSPRGRLLVTIEREDLQLVLDEAFRFFCIGQEHLSEDVRVTLEDDRILHVVRGVIAERLDCRPDQAVIVGIDIEDIDLLQHSEEFSPFCRFPAVENQAELAKDVATGRIKPDHLTDEQFRALFQRTRQEMADGTQILDERPSKIGREAEELRRLFVDPHPSLFSEADCCLEGTAWHNLPQFL